MNTDSRISLREATMAQNPISQSDAFKEAARELGADQSDDALDRIMSKLELKKKPENEKPRREGSRS